MAVRILLFPRLLSALILSSARSFVHHGSSFVKGSRLHSIAIPASDYLSSISTISIPTSAPAPSLPKENQIKHASRSFFDIEKLTPKGPRANADVGTPHDATRPLDKTNVFSAGSWWCAAGGWPSLTPRATTEIFYVFQGHGCLTDLDGHRNYFGPGDTVILPKGWSGRWDVLEDIHKVWFVHDHENIEVTTKPIRAIITHYNELIDVQQEVSTIPHLKTRTLYNTGPIGVASAHLYQPGSTSVSLSDKTEGIHVLDGLFFVTNEDGTAHRCTSGDTIVFPQGWNGSVDVIEPVTYLSVVV